MAVGAGVAYAYWTGGGTGTGANQNSAGQLPVAVSQTANLKTLAPGGSIALADFLTNPNTAVAKVGTLTAVVTSVDNGANLADYSITGNTPVPADGATLINANVVNGTPLAWSGLTLNYKNDPLVNQDTGKNATVQITYTLGAFAENVLPPLGTSRVLTVNGVRMFDIYVHMVGTTTILPGYTLSTYDMNAVYGTPGWMDNLATADINGNIRYYAPVPTPGHVYQITIKNAAGSMMGNLPSLS